MDKGKTPALKETPSQTAGPYVHIGLMPEVAGLSDCPRSIAIATASGGGRDGGVTGQRIVVEGHILDGSGETVRDAVIEVWQADHAGKFVAESLTQGGGIFIGFRRVATDFETGAWRIETIKPGAAGDGAAPCLNLWIVARGINIGLNTRIYFADEAEANANDPLLSAIAEPKRRDTLIASHEGETGGVPHYTFTIRLQGEGETVFLDV